MKEKYEYLFQLYLKVCEGQKNWNTEKRLKDAIRMADNLKNELYGMISFMREMGVLNWQEAEKEKERIQKTFSSLSLFGTYIEEGELYVFRKVG